MIKSFLKVSLGIVFVVSAFAGCSSQIETRLAGFESLTFEQSEQIKQSLIPLNIPLETWNYKRIRSTKPIAASYRGALIISDGLFSRLSTSSELSFILAHEFAHKKLNHDLQDKPPLKLEIEADKIALFMLIKANLPPHSAIAALSRMLDDPSETGATSPDLSIAQRIQSLIHLIPQSPR